MSRPAAECADLLRWLRANLGAGVLGALTGTDAKALAAAVHIVELFAYSPSDEILAAFAAVVRQMQPSTRFLAFHAVAKVMDWDDRERVWEGAGLEPFPAGVPECLNAPSRR